MDDDISKNLENINNKVNNLSTAVKSLGSILKGDVSGFLTSANNQFESMDKVIKNIVKSTDKWDNNLFGLSNELNGLSRNYDNVLRKVKESLVSGEISVEEAMKMSEELINQKKLLIKNIGLTHSQGESIKSASEEYEEQLAIIQESGDELEKNKKKLEEMADNKKRSQNNPVINFNDDIGIVKDLFTSLGEGPKAMQRAAESAGKLSSRLAKAGIAGKIFGGAIGIAAKAIGSWPVMLGVMIVGTLAKAANAIDKFVKEANAGFAEVRGPDIGTKDLVKQFDTFNKVIYNFALNLETGLDSKELREFASSLTQSGLHLSKLSLEAGGFTKAILISSKASKTLGIEMNSIGKYISDAMLEMRMSLDQIDTAFVQVAFDARKAGITTDMFWNAIENATSGLAFYGVFLKEASNTFKEITKTQVMGAKESAEVTTEFYQMAKKNSTKSNLALVDFAINAGVNISGMYKKLREERDAEVEKYREQIISVEAEIKGEEGRNADEDKLAQLNDKLKESQILEAKAQMMSRRFQRAERGDRIAMAHELAALAEKTPGLLIDIFQGIIQGVNLTDINAEQLETLYNGMANFGVSKEMVDSLVRISQTTNDRLGNLLGINKTSLTYSSSLLGVIGNSEEKLKSLQKIMKDVSGELSYSTLDTVTDQLRKYLGMGESNATEFVKAVTSSEELRDLFSDNNLTTEELNRRIKELVASGKVGTKFQKFLLENGEENINKLKEDSLGTHKDIVDQTLTFEKSLAMAKDSATMWAAMVTNTSRLTNVVTQYVRDKMKDKFKDPVEELSRKALKEKEINVKSSSDAFTKYKDYKNKLNSMQEERKSLTMEKSSASTIKNEKDLIWFISNAKKSGNLSIADEYNKILEGAQKSSAGLEGKEKTSAISDYIKKAIVSRTAVIDSSLNKVSENIGKTFNILTDIRNSYRSAQEEIDSYEKNEKSVNREKIEGEFIDKILSLGLTFSNIKWADINKEAKKTMGFSLTKEEYYRILDKYFTLPKDYNINPRPFVPSSYSPLIKRDTEFTPGIYAAGMIPKTPLVIQEAINTEPTNSNNLRSPVINISVLDRDLESRLRGVVREEIYHGKVSD